MNDEFKAVYWDDPMVPQEVTAVADTERASEGFEPYAEARVFNKVQREVGFVCIYKRKPPTLLEAAKACVSMWRGGERGGAWLRLPEITVLEEAIAREEAKSDEH